MAPFYGWGSTTSRLALLRGGSLLFTTKFPEIPYFHLNYTNNSGNKAKLWYFTQCISKKQFYPCCGKYTKV